MNPPHPVLPSSALREGIARVVRAVAGALARLVYRINVYHPEHIPATGGVLLLPNHITWIDALILQFSCPRPIRFLVYESYYRHPLLHPVLKLVRSDPHLARARQGCPARRQ